MAIVDRIVKELLIEGGQDVAAWLLGMDVKDVTVETIELPSDALFADAVFQVQLVDGRSAILHIEIQGRRSVPPMPQRMLTYIVLLWQRYELPGQSTDLYTEPNAGSSDTGEHHQIGLDGRPFLNWHYQVIHLWKLRAEEILSLGRRSLAPLVGLTKIDQPEQTIQATLAEIHQEPDDERQIQLLRQLVGLLQDEEIIAMIEEQLTKEDIEDMKRHPFLWRSYQEMLEHERNSPLREVILDVVVTRINPPASDYRALEKALAEVKDTEQLKRLHHRALRMADVDELLAAINTQPAQ